MQNQIAASQQEIGGQRQPDDVERRDGHMRALMARCTMIAVPTSPSRAQDFWRGEKRVLAKRQILTGTQPEILQLFTSL